MLKTWNFLFLLLLLYDAASYFKKIYLSSARASFDSREPNFYLIRTLYLMSMILSICIFQKKSMLFRESIFQNLKIQMLRVFQLFFHFLFKNQLGLFFIFRCFNQQLYLTVKIKHVRSCKKDGRKVILYSRKNSQTWHICLDVPVPAQ